MNNLVLAEVVSTFTESDKAIVAASSIISAFITVGLITGLVIAVLFIIAWWKIFEKAGVKGWKSLIPIYNMYCLYRISGMSGWWCLFPIIPSLCFSFSGASTATTDAEINNAINNPLMWIGCIMAIVEVVVAIVQVVKLAEGFKKGTGFKVASVFFPNITSLILAFGSAKYNKKFLHD